MNAAPVRRVVATGIGAITPIGIGVDGLRKGLRAGKSAVSVVDYFDSSPFVTHIAAMVKGFDPTPYLDGKKLKRLDKFSQFAVAASKMAIKDAQLDLRLEDRDRIGVCLGTALGGVGFAEEQYSAFLTQGPRAVNPMLALSVFNGAGSCNIAIELGVTGPATANGDSCASSPIAIGRAVDLIREGTADIMLAGGSEAPLSTLCFGAFALIRAMSQRNDDPATASRPFDKDRDGFVMAEGAAMLVLEEYQHAVDRGATIYGEILSHACTNDAFHMTQPRPDGTQAARCLSECLRKGNIQPNQLGYINAHGSSTPLNDGSTSPGRHPPGPRGLRRSRSSKRDKRIPTDTPSAQPEKLGKPQSHCLPSATTGCPHPSIYLKPLPLATWTTSESPKDAASE